MKKNQIKLQENIGNATEERSFLESYLDVLIGMKNKNNGSI